VQNAANHVQTGQRVRSVLGHENRLVVFFVPLDRFVYYPGLDDLRVTGKRVPRIVPIEADDVQVLSLRVYKKQYDIRETHETQTESKTRSVCT